MNAPASKRTTHVYMQDCLPGGGGGGGGGGPDGGVHIRRSELRDPPRALVRPEHTDTELAGLIHDVTHAMHEVGWGVWGGRLERLWSYLVGWCGREDAAFFGKGREGHTCGGAGCATRRARWCCRSTRTPSWPA